MPRLPVEVQRIGVVTQKTSPDMLMVIHLTSDDRYDLVVVLVRKNQLPTVLPVVAGNNNVFVDVPAGAATGLGSLPGTCWTLAGGLMLVAATPLAGPTFLYLPTAGQSLAKNLLYAAIDPRVRLADAKG